MKEIIVISATPIDDAGAAHALAWQARRENCGQRDFLFAQFESVTGEGVLILRGNDSLCWNADGDTLSTPTTGQRLKFVVRANPVSRVYYNMRASRKRQLVPLRDAEAIEHWLTAELAKGGAALASLQMLTQRASFVANKQFYINDVLIKGQLSVTDKTQFSDLLRDGFGRQRAYGYGMLIIEGTRTYELASALAEGESVRPRAI